MPDNLSETASRMGAQAGSMAEQARNAVTQAANKAKELGNEGYQYAAEKTAKAKNAAEQYIHDNPWYAVGIGVGLGLLLGSLIRWRTSRQD